MWKIDRRDNASFRARLLTGFFAIFVLAWIGSVALVIADNRENIDQLCSSHGKWLETYAETFLSDIEVGNTLSVQKKLDILAQRGLVSRVLLKFGKHELIAEKTAPSARNWAARFQRFLARCLGRAIPRSRLSLDVADSSGTVWGSLAVELDEAILYGPAIHSLENFAVYGGAFFLICIALILWFIDDLSDKVMTLIRYTQTISRAAARQEGVRELLEIPPKMGVIELDLVAREFSSSIAHVLRLEEEMKARRVDAAIGEAARQVAHDIRSPLAALDSVLRGLSQLPEDKRVVIRSAVGRIRDIANNLIERNKVEVDDGKNSSTAGSEGASERTPAELLSSLVDSLITEKRLQFRAQLGVEIDSRLDQSSYGLFVESPAPELKRALSNLINNAVEALPGKGLVTVTIASVGELIEIVVRDNGKGIPPETLARLGQRGVTYGKSGGSGLGLHHAKTSVESWGGRLDISSEPGKGTTVIMRLPRGRTPDWFVSGLRILPGTAVVILDDDTSIHQVWRGRFESAHARDHAVEVIHFSTPEELRAWARSVARSLKNTLYLMDYELLGYKETGLSLAEELGIGDSTILVTSRFEEHGVRAESLRIKARLIPKALAGFVPIIIGETASPEKLDAVLIDDDALARMNWGMAAKKSAKKFRAFSTVEEFLASADAISRDTPIYVDANLADGVDGAKESSRIHALGFQEIRLATGHPAEKFSTLTHLRGVVGKSPPWDAPQDAEQE